MEPRLDSSKSWTSFPQEYENQIKDVFSKSFSKKIHPESQVLVSGRIFEEELILQIGLLYSGRITQHNFEASIDFDLKTKKVTDQALILLEAIGSMVEVYYSDEDVEFSRRWEKFDFSDDEVYLKYSTVNTQLEAEADRILGTDPDSLYHDVEESEDALGKADSIDHQKIQDLFNKKNND